MKPNAGRRDPRLDFLRGLALVTIFVNHVPGNVYEAVTSRNFGFSDAAEAFVLMAGAAAALAYGSKTLRSFAEGFRAAALRSLALYRTHLLVTFIALIVCVPLSNAIGAQPFLFRHQIPVIFADPWSGTAGILLLGLQFGYLNILPLYAVLILAAPFILKTLARRPWATLIASLAVWALAGTFRINLPHWPGEGGWFLNPLSWQLIFTIGAAAGMAAREGRAFVRFTVPRMALAAAYLLGALAVVKLSLWSHVTFASLPAFIGGFDKSYLALPRLLHVMALAYVVYSIPAFARASASAAGAPMRFLGQNSLAVFATGSVTCLAIQVLNQSGVGGFVADTALISAGLALQFFAAAVSGRRPGEMRGFGPAWLRRLEAATSNLGKRVHGLGRTPGN